MAEPSLPPLQLGFVPFEMVAEIDGGLLSVILSVAVHRLASVIVTVLFPGTRLAGFCCVLPEDHEYV